MRDLSRVFILLATRLSSERSRCVIGLFDDFDCMSSARSRLYSGLSFSIWLSVSMILLSMSSLRCSSSSIMDWSCTCFLCTFFFRIAGFSFLSLTLIRREYSPKQ